MNKHKLLYIIICIFITACSINNKLCYLDNYDLSPRKIKTPSIALVLGGGGIKGFAHIGVLKALEEENIPIELIVGTSSGSIVGALYSDYVDAKKLENRLVNLDKWDVLDLSVGGALSGPFGLVGAAKGNKLQHFIHDSISTNSMKDLKIPFIAVSTDIKTGEAFPISFGAVSTAVYASSAIPPIFAPVYAYGKNLVDGGVTEPVASEIAKSYSPKIIITVNICAPCDGNLPSNMYDLVYKSVWISYYEFAKYKASLGDIVISPDMNGLGFFTHDNSEEIIQRGYIATKNKIKEIKLLMKMKNIKKRFL